MTKRIQIKLSGYFSSLSYMTRPERRCMKDMVTGILKSRSVFVNQIAASLRKSLMLNNVAKRLSARYLKEDYADKVLEDHLAAVAPGVSKEEFIVMDGTDISKKHAKNMEGLKFVKNGDTGGIGLGYNVLNIKAVNAHKEITPILDRAYSFEMGALSGNNEIKKAVRKIKGRLDGKGCRVFDRGADNGILKDFFIGESPRTIVRLKKATKVDHGGVESGVRELAKKMNLSIGQKVVKIKKNRPVVEIYNIGAVPIDRVGRTVHHLWWSSPRTGNTAGIAICSLRAT